MVVSLWYSALNVYSVILLANNNGFSCFMARQCSSIEHPLSDACAAVDLRSSRWGDSEYWSSVPVADSSSISGCSSSRYRFHSGLALVVRIACRWR